MEVSSRITSCKWCRSPLTHVERGRPRKYCSHSCRQRAYESRKWGIEEVWQHFRQSYKHCYLCGTPLDWSQQQTVCVDHMIATVHGGRTDVENLRPVHLGCNARKGAKLITEQFLRAA